jgi:hypothetical protein
MAIRTVVHTFDGSRPAAARARAPSSIFEFLILLALQCL